MRYARTLRLSCPQFSVDVRLRRVEQRWLASADTVEGPTIGLGRFPLEAVVEALRPFDAVIDDLLETIPEEVYWLR